MFRCAALIQKGSMQPSFIRLSPSRLYVVKYSTTLSTVIPKSYLVQSAKLFIPSASLSDSSSFESGGGNFQGSSDSTTTFTPAMDANLKYRILESALLYVPKYGWTREAVEASCQAEGLPPGLHSFAMPQGGIDLVLHFYSTRNEQLAEAMATWRAAEMHDLTKKTEESGGTVDTASQSPPKVTDVDAFLYQALEYRLKLLIPILDVWPQALGILALPSHIPSSVGLLAQLVDEIWAQAGDRSTDMTWYAKRLGLAYVYNLTEVFMLQDKSPDLQDTWTFLRSRIQDLRSMKQMNLKAVTNMVKSGVCAFGNVTFNVLGLNRNR